MTEVELLGYILQHGEVSSTDVARKYGIRIDHAYQVLRRLEQKGLLKRASPDYGAKYQLTDKAQQMSQEVKESDGTFAALLFLGLAVAILILVASGGDKS